MSPGPSAFQPPAPVPFQGLEAGETPRASGGFPLPCLSSNNCTDHGLTGAWNRLSGAHKKTAHALCVNIQAMAEHWGLERLGFLTLTFAEHLLDFREAARRFHSLATHVLKARYVQCIRIAERQVSGRWHFHLVVVLPADIRTGADFAGFVRGDYRSASPALRAEWAFWRRTARNYGFGRTELLPVRSTAEGVARYVGGYISKHIQARHGRDKGARLVGYVGFKPGVIGEQRRASGVFGWVTPGGWEWRCKLAEFARRAGADTMDDLKRLFGPRWAYHFQDTIRGIPLTECPNAFPRGSAEAAAAVQATEAKRWKRPEDPIWAVPRSWRPPGVVEPAPADEVAAAEARAVEMALYAMRLPPLRPPPEWLSR